MLLTDADQLPPPGAPSPCGASTAGGMDDAAQAAGGDDRCAPCQSGSSFWQCVRWAGCRHLAAEAWCSRVSTAPSALTRLGVNAKD